MSPVFSSWGRAPSFTEARPLSLSPRDCKAVMFTNGPGVGPDSPSLHTQSPMCVGLAYHCLGVVQHRGWTALLGPLGLGGIQETEEVMLHLV